MGCYQKLDFGAGLRSPMATISALPSLFDRPALVIGKDVYGKHLMVRDHTGAEHG
jgi:hypothetical protein